ncbi:hypothetical protein SCD_n01365 [Sulfuricella denitrificans skB26]|uniref:Uncharacterized protein n=1 Tax=Sulfuricella denitrificans (strain DSM 22764 / NBRC 105220 / skB26) TaxID=1163617 RepID=S6AGP4_SULDS|nr:hypothetical protein [Sulfuricella denitrificans]BAN35191.1 hypothetical protein SCD_n01365 [Sulfuricella denitrificans skB26]
MKRSALLLCCLSLALSAHATDSITDAGLAETQILGSLNGQALACGYAETASLIKSVIIQHAPKSRRYGAAFEEATNKAFLDHNKNEQTTCPDGPTLNGQVDEAIQRLQAAVPASVVK